MRDDRGITMFEVLLAVAIIGVTLLAVAPMFVYAMQTNATGADLGTTAALASARMEILRGLEFDDLQLSIGGSLDANVTNGVDYFDVTQPGHIVRWEIAAGATLPDTKAITVRAIALQPAIGQPKQVTLTTLRGE